MDFKEFEEMKVEPAKIESTVDENGCARTKMEGRGIELLGLSVEIAVNCMKQYDMPVEIYCEMLKSHMNIKQRKNDVENIIKKMLGDL